MTATSLVSECVGHEFYNEGAESLDEPDRAGVPFIVKVETFVLNRKRIEGEVANDRKECYRASLTFLSGTETIVFFLRQNIIVKKPGICRAQGTGSRLSVVRTPARTLLRRSRVVRGKNKSFQT